MRAQGGEGGGQVRVEAVHYLLCVMDPDPARDSDNIGTLVTVEAVSPDAAAGGGGGGGNRDASRAAAAGDAGPAVDAEVRALCRDRLPASAPLRA